MIKIIRVEFCNAGEEVVKTEQEESLVKLILLEFFAYHVLEAI